MYVCVCLCTENTPYVDSMCECQDTASRRDISFGMPPKSRRSCTMEGMRVRGCSAVVAVMCFEDWGLRDGKETRATGNYLYTREYL